MQFLACESIVIKDATRAAYDCINPSIIDINTLIQQAQQQMNQSQQIDINYLSQLCTIGFIYVAGLLIVPVILRHLFSEVLKIFDIKL